jgi:hypothetical protein
LTFEKVVSEGKILKKSAVGMFGKEFTITPGDLLKPRN